MKKIFIVLALSFTFVGCGPSDETIELSRVIHVYTAQNDSLLRDFDGDPEKLELIKKNSAALKKATKALWLLLLGKSEDEVIE